MFAKLLTVVIFATALGALLLGLRQQRLQMMHEMAQLHAQIDDARQRTWDLQVRIAEGLRPEALREAVARAGLTLEPVLPADGPLPGSPPRVAEIDHVDGVE